MLNSQIKALPENNANISGHNKSEILIIGAGPSGTSASIQLAKRGLSSIIVDQQEFPRDKVCGDAVSGEGLSILNSFGLFEKVENDGYKCTRKELHTSSTRPRVVDTDAIDIPREKLDVILLNKAISMGAEFICARFTGKIEYKDNYHKAEFIDTKSKETLYIYARYLIMATGCQSDQALNTIKKRHKIARPDQVAYRGYYQADWPIKERQYFFLSELTPGYLWIFPLGNGLFNVGCGGKILKVRKLKLKECLDNFIAKTNDQYNCTGSWVKKPKGAALSSNFPNLINLREFPNLILIGETMGCNYPFSGGGIGKAMTSGVLAAKSIIEVFNKTRPIALSKVYIRKINKEMKPPYYFAFKFCDYLFTKTFLQKFIFKKVFKNITYPDIIPNIISEKYTPKQICSINFIIRFLLSK